MLLQELAGHDDALDLVGARWTWTRATWPSSSTRWACSPSRQAPSAA